MRKLYEKASWSDETQQWTLPRLKGGPKSAAASRSKPNTASLPNLEGRMLSRENLSSKQRAEEGGGYDEAMALAMAMAGGEETKKKEKKEKKAKKEKKKKRKEQEEGVGEISADLQSWGFVGGDDGGKNSRETIAVTPTVGVQRPPQVPPLKGLAAQEEHNKEMAAIMKTADKLPAMLKGISLDEHWQAARASATSVPEEEHPGEEVEEDLYEDSFEGAEGEVEGEVSENFKVWGFAG